MVKRMEMLQDEQIIASKTVGEYRFDGFGVVRQPEPAARFSQTPASIRRPAPQLGEHSIEILDQLGMNQDAVERLIETGVLVAGKSKSNNN